MSQMLETPQECIRRHKIFAIHKPNSMIVNCLNKEHEDSSPSMHISNESGMFHCFSCGFKGNYRVLRRLLGDEETPDEIIQFKAAKLQQVLKAAYTTHEYVEVPTPSGKISVQGGWRNVSKQTLEKFDAFISDEEEFANRLWLPIYHNKKLIAYQGRAMQEGVEPKYKFYPRHVYMNPIIYGIESIPGHTAILVEGIFDMLNLRDKGIDEACTIFGSHIGMDKIYTLLTYDIHQVVLMLDPDNAGKTAMKKAKKLLAKHAPQIAVDCVYLSGDSDPGDLMESDIIELTKQDPLRLHLQRNIK